MYVIRKDCYIAKSSKGEGDKIYLGFQSPKKFTDKWTPVLVTLEEAFTWDDLNQMKEDLTGIVNLFDLTIFKKITIVTLEKIPE
jgi:hypothetical protein